MAKVAGLLLASAPSEEPQFIPGIPGLWSTSEAVVPSAVGVTLADLRALLDDAGIEYREVKVGEVEEALEPAAGGEAEG